MLKDLSCEPAQGYLYSKLAPGETIEQRLSNAHATNASAHARAKAASLNSV